MKQKELKLQKGDVECFDIAIAEFPMTMRYSLRGCASQLHGTSGGPVRIEVFFDRCHGQAE